MYKIESVTWYPVSVVTTQGAELTSKRFLNMCQRLIRSLFRNQKKIFKMRQPGVEPGSAAWKAAMLTVTPLTLVGFEATIGMESLERLIGHLYSEGCNFRELKNGVKS